MRVFRLLRIIHVMLRFGLDEFLLGHERVRGLRAATRAVLFWRDLSAPRAVRLRCALEALGPIFVKFGQVLSTRRDLLPLDIADELARLQDRVPPFAAEQVLATLRQAYDEPLDRVFPQFEPQAVASASVAQVHLARLADGREAAVKVLRPGIRPVIERDISLLYVAAGMVEQLFADGQRLRPREVVAEFEKTIHDELDLIREAANASQLRRNFHGSALLQVPEVYWDWCRSDVMVMERMHGTPISQVAEIRRQGIDIPALARHGVEIFFTQVFRDGFFHADMHPGNIRVASDGRYIALDFGIMGTLEARDQEYLARNFLAFFRRDYRQVAEAHIEAGWVPKDTRVDQFEAAVRAVCEPIFDKPLKEISFGRVLLRLFETSRRFNMQVQPQLVLLQKTLLNIEGLGRDLDPELDLWKTARPFLEQWMKEQLGFAGLRKRLRRELPMLTRILPELPRLIHRRLSDDTPQRVEARLAELAAAQARHARWLAVTALLVALLLGWQAYRGLF